MIEINRISDAEFNLSSFDIVLGEYATYNSYYEVKWIINNCKIGIQALNTGIKPQIIEDKKNLLIGVYNVLYIIHENRVVKEISLDDNFCEMRILNEGILIINETSLVFINYDYEIKWQRFFDIILKSDIKEKVITVKDYSEKKFVIDLLTGKTIEK